MSQTDPVFSESSPALAKIDTFHTLIWTPCRHPSHMGPVSYERAVSLLFIATCLVSLTYGIIVPQLSEHTHPRPTKPPGGAAACRACRCLRLDACNVALPFTRYCSAVLSATTMRLVLTCRPISPLYVDTTLGPMACPSPAAAACRHAHPRPLPEVGKCFPGKKYTSKCYVTYIAW